MTEFDPLRAAKEQLHGIVDILNTMKRREDAVEMQLALCESELTDVRKLRAFAQGEAERLRARVAALEEESR